MRRRFALALTVFALLAAACGDGNDSADEVSVDDTSTTTTAVEVDPPADVTTTTAPSPAPDYSDYEATAAGIAQATTDRELPPDVPAEPIGSYGYSRYVYTQSGEEVVPSLIEGPLGYQVRCQEEARDCSYQELKALYDSGEEPPSYLGMDRDTLGELVAQLDRVNVAINQYEDLDAACAAGFRKSTNQVANMGIHMIDRGATDFDPDRPQMVLFAKEGGFGLGREEIGDCVNGAWTGEDGYEPVGAVFNITLTEEHPEGFAGPIDNWHIHYNTCIGRSAEVADGLDPNSEPVDSGAAEGARSSTSRETCEARGGNFIPVIPSWMMHAYVADDFDAQSGVFSMFNPTIWPLSDADSLADSRVVEPADDVEAAPIINFAFGEITVAPGDTIRFSNSDSVPHTVTAGSFIEPSDEFDSGVLGTGDAYDLAFDEPGEYAVFCVLHPDMSGTVTVE